MNAGEGFSHKCRPLRDGEALPIISTKELLFANAIQQEARRCEAAEGATKSEAERRADTGRKFVPHLPLIKKMLSEGKANKEIADKIGVNVNSVAAYLMKRGMRPKIMGGATRVRRDHCEAILMEKTDFIKKLLVFGKSGHEIAALMKMNTRAVNMFINKNGLRNGCN